MDNPNEKITKTINDLLDIEYYLYELYEKEDISKNKLNLISFAIKNIVETRKSLDIILKLSK